MRWRSVIAAALGALSLKAVAEAGPGLERVIVGHLPTSSTAALYVAVERGFFSRYGLQVELVPFTSSIVAYPQMAIGRLDVYAGGVGVSLFNAIGQGIRLRIVADKNHELRGSAYKQVVVRRDLWEAGIVRSLRDLRGRRVASLPLGSGMGFQTHVVLRSAGLGIGDVEYVELGLGEITTALANRAIDAAVVFEPVLSAVKVRGLGVPLASVGDVYPGLQAGVITYSERFVRERRAVGERFMAGYLLGVEVYNDGIFGGDEAKRRWILEAIQRWVPGTSREVLERVAWHGTRRDGRVNVQSLREEMEFYLRQGMLIRPVEVETVVDHAFLEAGRQYLKGVRR